MPLRNVLYFFVSLNWIKASQLGFFLQNFLFSRIPYYQNVYAVGLTLKYKKFCMGLFSLGVLLERISNVEKMYRARPRGYSLIRVWFLYSTLELWSILYTIFFCARPEGSGWGYCQNNCVGACGPLPKTLTLIMTKICDFAHPFWPGKVASSQKHTSVRSKWLDIRHVLFLRVYGTRLFLGP